MSLFLFFLQAEAGIRDLTVTGVQTCALPISAAEEPEADEPAIPAPEASSGAGTIIISSVPDGAEIFVDEKFHGNTPATLRLPTGSHAIVLKFPGRADWKRTLEVLKSSKVTLRATLDRAP